MSQNSPRIGCAAVIRHKDTILLGRRNKDPERGKWVLPGGRVEFLEPLKVALQREIREEIGIEIGIDNIVGVYELINPPHNHGVIIYWWADYVSGNPIPSSDISECAFFPNGKFRIFLAGIK
ncbi:MAG: NUDIX domain-containing protein [Deltaproteobacteria bacterium]|nr:NUDIX domain-containing protein [Deltaproteobacteria bacterium]